MPETEESLRDRALAAWRERKQEMAVEAERRETEQKLRALRSATAWTVMVLADDGEFRSDGEVGGAAKILGVEASEPQLVGTRWWTLDLSVGHMTFRWTSIESGMATGRFELVGECPDCGADVLFGYRIANLTALGTALDEQMHNAKAMHLCPADRDDNGEPMVGGFAESESKDPADVLLDALQTYIHASIEAAITGLTAREF